MLLLCLIFLFGYILGSFPSSLVIGRLLKGIDLRQHGSGNLGASNTMRVLGFGWGALVFFLDFFKGALPVFLASYFAESGLFSFEDLLLQGYAAKVAGGAGAILGHVFPVFAGFKGGKGVATAAGVLLGLFPLSLIFCVLVFAVVLFSSGYVSLSSLITAFGFPFLYLFLEREFSEPLFSQAQDFILLPLVLVLPLAIFYLHRANIGRIIKGTENRFEKVWLLKGLFDKKPKS